MPYASYNLITPSNVSVVGTSANITGNGKVNFVAATTLKINGIFNNLYDEYTLLLRTNSTAGGVYALGCRLNNNTIDASGTDYISAVIQAYSTTISAMAYLDTKAYLGYLTDGNADGFVINISSPFLAEKTKINSWGSGGYANAYLTDGTNLHVSNTSYNGITLLPSTGTMTGNLYVYGVKK